MLIVATMTAKPAALGQMRRAAGAPGADGLPELTM
jgi:hypothetical protein